MTQTQLFKNEFEAIVKTETFKNYITSRDYFTSTMLNFDLFEDRYNPSIITKALKSYIDTPEGRVLTSLAYTDFCSSPTQFYWMDYNNVGCIQYMGKEKNLLVFNFIYASESRKKDSEIITYDFITKTLSKKIEYKDIINKSDYDSLFYESIINEGKCLIPEWIFTYITDLKELSSLCRKEGWYDCYAPFQGPLPKEKEYIQQCPKGFINFIKENNMSLTYESIVKYAIKKELGNIGYMIYYRAEGYITKNEIAQIIAKKGLITNVIKNSWVKDTIGASFDTIILDLIDNKSVISVEQMLSLLSDSDTCKTFSQKLKAIKDRETNKVLAVKLQQLNFLNNKTFGLNNEYTVIVPQNINDLQKEGDAMHNCVGHYYNDSIIENRNLIYFIRKSDSINKSFVTCRYNFERKSTIEARAFANRSIPREVQSILPEITNLITDWDVKRKEKVQML